MAHAELHRVELAPLEMLTGQDPPIAFLEQVRGHTLLRGPAVAWELVDAALRTTRVRTIARRVTSAIAAANASSARAA